MKLTDKEQKVLQTMYFTESPTRNSISKQAGLSVVLISPILAKLEELSYIQKVGKTVTRGGRPSAIYQLHPSTGYHLGISVNVNSITLVLMNAAEVVIKKENFPLNLSGDPEQQIDKIVDLISREATKVLHRLGNGGKTVSLGCSVPGMVDTENGIWMHGLQVTGISGVNLQSSLESRLNIPVIIEDCSRATTLRELKKGAGKGLNNAVLLYLSSEVGTGIVINGELYRGHKGLSGEIGHLIVEKEGTRCTCGNVGCLETIASSASIIRRFRQKLEDGVISCLQKFILDETIILDLPAILEAARENDKLTLTTLFEIGQFLGDACSKLIKLYSPGTLIISGPVSSLSDYLKESMNIVIKQLVLPEMLEGFNLIFADYTEDHEAEGAALSSMKYFWENISVNHSLIEKI